MKKIFLIIFSSLALLGCKEKIDQGKMCVYSNNEDALMCQDGQLSFFKADRWGNEQLPLSVAAAYCDFNYQIMHTNAGVICVFTNKRISTNNK